MQEDKILLYKHIKSGKPEILLESLAESEKYFCYCGGKVFEQFRVDLKTELINNFLSHKNPEKIENLFSTQEGLELNRKYFKLRRQIIARKIQCLKQLREGKYLPSDSSNPSQKSSESVQKKIEDELKEMINQSSNHNNHSGILGKRGHPEFEYEPNEVVQSLREDLEKMIQVAENRKIDRVVMQPQLLRSEAFRKMMTEMKRVIDYARFLEGKVDSFGKLLLEVDWLRKKELDQIEFKEAESNIFLIFL